MEEGGEEGSEVLTGVGVDVQEEAAGWEEKEEGGGGGISRQKY